MLKIGIPKEIRAEEKRVSAAPDTLEQITKLGCTVTIEAGAEEAAQFTHSAYRVPGAEIVPDPRALWAGSDILLKMRSPEAHSRLVVHELELLREGVPFISFIWPVQNSESLQRLKAGHASVIAMDAVPCTSRAQKLDALSSTANIPGCRAVIEAAQRLDRFFTGLCRATFAAAAVAMVLPVFGGYALAQAPTRVAPEHLSWYGDPKAPNLSGVWVGTDSAQSASPSKEGWLPWPPPLKAPFAATWKKRVADAAAGKRGDDPIRRCLPPGMPRFMSGTNGPLLIIQTPGRVLLYRDGIPVRRVWLDGRAPPDPKDLESFFNGNAIGHYEGSDLVTEVVGIKDQPIDSTGIPHSDDLKIVERMHRVNAKTLEVKITLTDPTAYAKPMTTTVTYKDLNEPSWEPKEFICTPETNYYPDKYVH